jgi:hypothetical protein
MSTTAALDGDTVRRLKRISTVVLFAAGGGVASLLNAGLFATVSKAFSRGHVDVIISRSAVAILVLLGAGIVCAVAVSASLLIALRLKLLSGFAARFRRPILGAMVLASTFPASWLAVWILFFVANPLLERTVFRSALEGRSEAGVAIAGLALLVVFFLGTHWLVKVYLSSLALRLTLGFQPSHLWFWTLVGAGTGLLLIWLAHPQLQTHGWEARLVLADGPVLSGILGWWIFEGVSRSVVKRIPKAHGMNPQPRVTNG